MATRDRTQAYIRFREASVTRRGPKRRTSMSAALLANAAALEEGGGLGDRMPPAWTKVSDSVKATMEKIKRTMKELKKLHTAHLRVEFDDDVDTEQRIEIMTAEVTKLFQLCQNGLINMNKMPCTSPQERALRNNVTKELAASIQQQSQQFRAAQKTYLQKLQALDSGTGDLFGGDGVDDVPLNFQDAGMSTQQLSQVHAMRHNAEQRDEEIVAVARSIEELSSLFKDLNMLVIEQGTILDRIDYNIEMTATYTDEAVSELEDAAEYQKKATKKKIICMFCLLVLLAIVVLMIQGIF